MKVICTAVLAATLLFSGSAPVKEVGYDIGACAPGESFVAAHIVYKDKESVTFTEFQTGPGVDDHFKPTNTVVYEYTSTDKDGMHYGYQKLVLVIVKADDKQIVGKFLKEGEVIDIVFGVAGDGSKLMEYGNELEKVCRSLDDAPDAPAPGPSPDKT